MRDTAGAYFNAERQVEDMAEIKSENTKGMAEDELKALQERVAAMTPDELREFRNSHDADSMGFWGKESL